VELERLERELELWLWSWSGWSAHEKVRTLLHFLACLLCRNAASSGARLRSFAARCFAATQQAPEPRSGALLRVACCALLCCALLCCAWLRSFTARCFAAALELCCALLCCGSGALLRVALLQLNPATQQALERLLQQKKKKNPEPFAPSSIFFILLWFS
jgi:hypothetical protein